MHVAPTGRSVGRRPSSPLAPIIIVALSIAFAPVFAGGATPPRITIAVFDFELEDVSPSAVLLSQPMNGAVVMDKVSGAAREELTRSGRYVVIDASKDNAKPPAEKAWRNCDGCEASIASQLGADQSLIGVVSKVTQTDYYVTIRIRDARTGKILDEQGALFAGDEQGWASGVRMLIRHQVLPSQGLNH